MYLFYNGDKEEEDEDGDMDVDRLVNLVLIDIDYILACLDFK